MSGGHPNSLKPSLNDLAAEANDVISSPRLDRRSLIQDVRSLSDINSSTHQFRSALAITTQWVIISLAISLAIYVNHWTVSILAICVIASRQHALGILMHDAAHFRLFNNRIANDLLSDWFCGFPVGVTTSLYRKTHFKHHTFVNDTARDPDRVCAEWDKQWDWPKTSTECAVIFVRDICGLNVIRFMSLTWRRWFPWLYFFMWKHDSRLTRGERISLIAWTAVVVSALYVTAGWWYCFLFWIVPASTVLVAIFRIRGLGEHYCVEEQNELNQTRTVIPRFWERIVICPLNINYHIEHHLFPGVPFYNLPRLHRRLMQEPEFLQEAHLTVSYTNILTGLLAELFRKRKL